MLDFLVTSNSATSRVVFLLIGDLKQFAAQSKRRQYWIVSRKRQVSLARVHRCFLE